MQKKPINTIAGRKAPSNTSPISPKHISIAILWFSEISAKDKWDLNIKQQALLLGVKERTYKYWKKKAIEGQEVEVSIDTQTRLSYLLGIMKGLKLIVPKNRSELAYEWFKSANRNPVFSGMSIRDYLLDKGSIISLHNTRTYLEASL